jgi:dTDP-4-amino-4,6-dideoxygalactose transaminase
VDCQPGTLAIDPGHVEAAITDRTRAIVPVHFAGQAADLRTILASATRRGIYVVEDAAQAHGTMWQGRRCGSIGVVGCFSFYPSKNLGAFGDGGAVVSRDPDVLARVRGLRDYGQVAKYRHAYLGYNRRLDELQAAVLRLKLVRLDAGNARRAAAATLYDAALDGTGIARPHRADDRTHVYHLYVVRSPRRDVVRAALEAQSIHTGIHYPIPLHLQEACADLGYRAGDFPVTEEAAPELLSLPMYPEITAEQVERVSRTLLDAVSSRS